MRAGESGLAPPGDGCVPGAAGPPPGGVAEPQRRRPRAESRPGLGRMAGGREAVRHGAAAAAQLAEGGRRRRAAAAGAMW